MSNTFFFYRFSAFHRDFQLARGHCKFLRCTQGKSSSDSEDDAIYQMYLNATRLAASGSTEGLSPPKGNRLSFSEPQLSITARLRPYVSDVESSDVDSYYSEMETPEPVGGGFAAAIAAAMQAKEAEHAIPVIPPLKEHLKFPNVARLTPVPAVEDEGLSDADDEESGYSPDWDHKVDRTHRRKSDLESKFSEPPEELDIDASFDGRYESSKVIDVSSNARPERAAALAIQCVYRGWIARRWVAYWRSQAYVAADPKDPAATILQRVFRGWRVRKWFKAVKAYRSACATVVQSAYRRASGELRGRVYVAPAVPLKSCRLVVFVQLVEPLPAVGLLCGGSCVGCGLSCADDGSGSVS